eukprot:Lankesteria_metandrocarpae@DN7170_c0_g1_i1.p1
MPIDINLLRVEKGGDPDIVRQSEQRRGRDVSVVDKIIDVDKKWRSAVYDAEQNKKEMNAANKEVGKRKSKDKTDACSDLVEKAAEYKQRQPELEALAVKISQDRDALLHGIGNILHESVPVHTDEAQNPVVRTWNCSAEKLKEYDGKSPGQLHHHQVLSLLGGVDFKRGVEVAGHRAYYLKGYAVMLNQALINYGLSFLRKKGYEPVQPPYFMRREVMSATAELKDFAEMLYQIPADEHDQPKAAVTENRPEEGSGAHSANRHDLFLIATSEQPISALHKDEFIDEKLMPIKYAGVSTCFRKEAGSHGKDTWGIFRVHQFEKVEQFIYCTPEASWEMHEEMILAAEQFYQTLDLPYRVVSIVSGAINDAAAKKYDLEAWFPGYNDYRELVSCSNCTDYQSRELNARCGHPKQGEREKRYSHLLNATLVATQRCMCCILENYQTPTGVLVPRALVPYMDGLEFLPFAEERAK